MLRLLQKVDHELVLLINLPAVLLIAIGLLLLLMTQIVGFGILLLLVLDLVMFPAVAP